MQAVTANLIAALNKPAPVYCKTVELSRLTWTGTAYAFDTASDITAQVVDAGRIMWKFDKEAFNSWTLDNVTLTLRNDRQQWKQDNPKGMFPSGYILRGSKIQVKVGAQLADGTYEKPYVFRGIINSDPIYDNEKMTVVVTVSGEMSIFELFNAEDISTTVKSQPPNIYVIFGSNSGTVFNVGVSGTGGVFKIWNVRRGTSYAAATALTENIDYTVSGLNVKGTRAILTLNSALTSGETLWGDYSYWLQDKTIEYIIGRVMTLCGITNYLISPAVFSSSVLNLVTKTTQADWQACTLSNINTTIVPDSALLDVGLFSEHAGEPPAWTIISGAWTNGGNAYYGAPTALGVNSCYASCRFNGIYQVSAQMGSLLFGNRTAWLGINENSDGSGTGYGFKFKMDGHVWFSGGEANELLDLGLVSPGFALKAFRFECSAAGVFSIYIDGVAAGTYDAGGPIGGFGFLFTKVTQDNTMDCYVRNFYTNYQASGTIKLPTIDCGASLSSYGEIVPIIDLPAGTSYKIETQSSANGSTWDAAVQVSNTGMPQSALKRYLSPTVTLYSDSGKFYSPSLGQLTVKYYTSSTLISLVNLTGMNCLQLLKDLAEKCCYEIGFDSTGRFVFRPRTTAMPPVMELTSATNVLTIHNTSDGIDRVCNYVEAKYGNCTVVADDSANTPVAYGLRGQKIKYSVGSSSLLPTDNVYLGIAIAPTILAYTKVKRRRCQAVCRFLPQLELGDNVRLSYEEPTALRPWRWGQPDAQWLAADTEFYSDSYKATRIAFWLTVMRIEGIEWEWWNDWKTTLDLVEVV